MTAAERRTWIRDYHRRTRAEWRAAGLCYKCGERPPSGGFKTCLSCRSADAHYARERRRRAATFNGSGAEGVVTGQRPACEAS